MAKEAESKSSSASNGDTTATRAVEALTKHISALLMIHCHSDAPNITPPTAI
jgi:hypothetical protein